MEMSSPRRHVNQQEMELTGIDRCVDLVKDKEKRSSVDDKSSLSIGVCLAILTGVLLAPSPASGQKTNDDANRFVTAWGDPDLQGTWTNTTSTNLERPTALVNLEFVTDELRAQVAAEAARYVDLPPPPGQTGAYNSFWLDQGELSQRTSLILEPRDGKLPALTPQAQHRADDFTERWLAPPESWHDMSLYDRCITRGLPGAMIPGFYNHNYLILQTPDYVVLQVEMIHDTRIIPLTARPRVGANIRQWLGDARAHWEGDTLVVETTNFTGKSEQRTAMGPFFLTLSTGKNLNLVERFTRIDSETMDYQFTVNDPTVYTKKWTAATPMRKTQDALFEYACHEGNYGLYNILAGARAQEREVGAPTQTGGAGN